jgi:predicted dehydrogenase
MLTSKTLAVGVVGAGAISRQSHLPVLVSMDGVKVAWLTDADRSRGESVARAYEIPFAPLPPNVDDLPPCDVALLAVPVGARWPYYEAFSRRGAAVLSEKPFARTVDEFHRIMSLFAPHRIGCGYQRRTYASMRLVREIVDADWFGPVRGLRVTEGARNTKAGVARSYLDDASGSGGGALIDLGSHTLDLAITIMRSSRAEVRAVDIVWDHDIDRKVEARVLLEGAAGAAELDYCVSWLDRQPNTVEIAFASVTVRTGVFPGAPVEIVPIRKGGRIAHAEPPRGLGAATFAQAFYLEWASFLDGVRRGGPSEFSAESCFLTTSLVSDLYARGRRP